MAIKKEYVRFGREKHAINKIYISRNYTKGRSGHDIKRIVLHTVGAPSDGMGIYNWFNRARSSGSSAHYYVHKDGKIWQYVRDSDMAWHAGTRDKNHPNNNFESIGIEYWDGGKYSGSAGKKRTKELYHNGGWLLGYLCDKHDIKCQLLDRADKWKEGVTKHNDYANKACPGSLDRKRLANTAREFIAREHEVEAPPEEPVKPEDPDCKEYRARIENLRDQVKMLEGTVAEYQKTKDDYKVKIAGLEGKVKKLSGTVARLEEVIEEKDGIIEKESDHTKKWKVKYEDLLKEYGEQEESGPTLREAIRDLLEAVFGKPE